MAAIAVTGVMALPAAAQEAITLEDAIQLANGRSPTLAGSMNAVVNAEQGRRTAIGAFLPGANASLGFTRTPTSQVLDPETNQLVTRGSGESLSSSVSGSYTLYSGGSRFATLNQSNSNLAAANARYLDSEYQVELQTKNFFFNALRQQELLDVAQTSVERAEESLAFTRRLTDVGRGTRSDTLRARLELQNAQLSLIQAENATRAAQLALGRQIGLDRPMMPVRPDDIDPRELALGFDEIIQLAQSSSPSVIAAEASTDAARASARVSRGGYFPSASLSSSYSWSNNAYSFQELTTNWNVRLSFSYNLFNGFSREAGVARANDQLRVAVLQEDDAKLAAREEADNAYRALETAQRAIEIADQSVVVAEEDLRVTQERYEVSVATILDVVTSQIALDQALANLVNARYDYVIARSQLEAILGRTL